MQREELSFEPPRPALAAGRRTGAAVPGTPCGPEATLEAALEKKAYILGEGGR